MTTLDVAPLTRDCLVPPHDRHAATEPVAPVVRWSWRSGVCRALAYDFELLVEPAELRAEMEPVIAPFVSRCSASSLALARYEVRRVTRSDGLRYSLYIDGVGLASGVNGADLTGMLTWHINQAVIRDSVERYVLLHASAATRGGITVILPADQESGKTTTIAGLLRTGYDYVTDEAVAIDPATGRVTPFHKTLSLDPGSWPLFPECAPVAGSDVWRRQWHVPPTQLGARSVEGEVAAPRVIVFPRYVRGACTTSRRMTRAESTQELARMTFEFSRFPARNLGLLGRITGGARCARLIIGSLDDAVLAIEELVSECLLEDL